MGGIRVFSIGDIPVSISPWYLLLAVFWLQGDLVSGVIWLVVVTVSILVHELGHALVARYYRLSPSILLWGLGGLCFHARAERDRHDALIIAAGPGAGLLLGIVVWAASFALPPPDPASPQLYWVHEAVSMLLWVNIGWSFVNLLPLWPLDGGQLFRLGLVQVIEVRLAEKITHGISLALVAVGVLIGWASGQTFLTILALFAGWQNIRALRGDVSSGTYRPESKQAKELLATARAAYTASDFQEAARICHQIRGIDASGDGVMRDAWAILGSATARLGQHDEALRYLDRAPLLPDVVEAKIECYHQLDMRAELDALLASKAFEKLGPSRRAEILALVRDPGE